ncbi:MAG TPA: polysaccharide deacetylase family protein [Candidatus Saccharimonadales bacterium]|nr:polysaccharide deacetylase family protein [Candidatus Saccharimonadales bacterium]
MIVGVLLAVLFIIIVLIIWLCFNPKFKIYSRSDAPTKGKLIALTFDDGPNSDSSGEILRILKRNSVKATFFVVGKNVGKYPDLLRKAFRDGHLIGNHSYLHDYRMARGSKAAVEDIEATSDAIYKVINRKPAFYRPPFGLRTPWGARAVNKSGYFIVTWDNMTYDYWGLSSERIVRNIVNNSRPGGIIVLHDGREGFSRPGSLNTVEALPGIIENLKQQGYKFVKLDELFGVSGYQA